MMKILARIWSWFWSTNSKRPTGITLFISLVILSGVIALVITPLLRNFENAFESSDWFSSEQPSVITSEQSVAPFLKKLRELVGLLENAPSPGTDEANEASLVQIGRGTRPAKMPACGGPPTFLYADIAVYPTCTTFSKREIEPQVGERKDVALTAPERAVFNAFARFTEELVTHYQSEHKRLPTENFEQVLADGLHISNLSPGGNRFSTPWLYAASANGALAVFPGAAVIGYDRWDITGRPWFMASLRGDTNLANTINGGDLLTVTYLDVLGERPLHVRTYLNKFQVGNETFVVGVDLNQAVVQGTRFGDTLSPTYISGDSMYGILFVSVLTLLASLAGSTLQRESRFVLRGGPFRSGPEISDVVKREETRRTGSKEEFKVDKAPISQSDTREQGSAVTEASEITTRRSVRGAREWEVTRATTYRWRFLRKFENVTEQPIGVLRVEFTRAVQPRAVWAPPLRTASFSHAELPVLEKDLPEALASHADRLQDSVDLAFTYPELRPSKLDAIRVPDCVRALLTPDDAVAIQYNRAYLTLRPEHLLSLYREADVKAVVLSTYLARLLERSDTSFLRRGRTIARLIAFSSEKEQLSLTVKAREQLAALIADYGNGRGLYRVNAPIDDIHDLQPAYDFALLTIPDPVTTVVVVSKTVSRASRIDTAGSMGPEEFIMEGYISWRQADIDFYSRLFAQLSDINSRRPLDLPAETSSQELTAEDA